MNYYLKKEFSNLETTIKSFKKIDFKSDIDKSKSDHYIIDLNTNDLQIMCQKEKKLLDYGWKNINNEVGNILYTSKIIKADIPLINKGWGGFYSLLYQIHNEEVIRAFINFNSFSSNLTWGISFSDFIYDLKWANSRIFKMYEENRMEAYLNYSKFNEYIACESKDYFNSHYFRKGKEGENVEYFFDFKNNYFYRNGRKHDLEKFGICKNNLKNLTIIIISSKKNDEFFLEGDNFTVGKKQGTIYLKPIFIQNKKNFRIKYFYIGNPDVEFYNLNKWERLNNLNTLYPINNNKILLRLNMSENDKISNIFIY